MSSARFLAAALLALTSGAYSTPTLSAEDGQWVVGVSGGTNGIAPEIGLRFGEHVGIRANGGFFNYSRTENIDDIDYDGKLKLNSVGLLADWFPMAGGFRISAGVRSNGNKIDLHATPTANVLVGDVSYTPAQVGNLDGKVEFNSLSPTLTLGYGGKLGSGFTLGFEAGVVMQGSPKINLASTGGTLSSNATFLAELEQERQQAEDDASDFKFWPVVQVHFLYRF
ncbi:MAG: hypothetical protein IT482_11230 [Gammaproteobacteria bacterium]|nr:hypothetical protein [Gammaproteobacteria bacterium]